jgi:antirestriction protein ArdC
MEAISRKVADALDSGQIPWRMNHYPRQIVSGRLFAGVNPILLQIAAARMNSSSLWWATKIQWELCGHMVIVGPEDGVQLPGKEDEVFNLVQTDGRYQPPTLTYRSPGSVFDTLIREAGIRVEYGIDATCHYERDNDLIRIPYPFMFIDGFFHALSHEIFHFTERRMDWNGTVAGDELRADIGAGYICAAIGVKPVRTNFRKHHDKFAPTWAADLRAKPGLLFDVCNNVTATISCLLSFAGVEVEWEMNPGNRVRDSGVAK